MVGPASAGPGPQPVYPGGGGGSGVQGSGTVNTIAKFTAADEVGDSRLTDNGTALALGGTLLAPSYQIVASLTDAQIKALPTTAVTILAAPGANRLIVPQVILAHMKWVANYTNINATSNISIDTAADFIASVSETSLSGVTALLAGGGPDGTWVPFTIQQLGMATTTSVTPSVNPHLHHGVADSGFYDADIVNIPLTISMENVGSGNLTGGNAGNELQISVAYYILNTDTGLFV